VPLALPLQSPKRRRSRFRYDAPSSRRIIFRFAMLRNLGMDPVYAGMARGDIRDLVQRNRGQAQNTKRLTHGGA